MKSIFVLMKGENGEPKKISEKGFAIEEKELDRLESDFKKYLSEEANLSEEEEEEIGSNPLKVKGGVYEYNINKESKKLFLRFDDVLVIY